MYLLALEISRKFRALGVVFRGVILLYDLGERRASKFLGNLESRAYCPVRPLTFRENFESLDF